MKLWSSKTENVVATLVFDGCMWFVGFTWDKKDYSGFTDYTITIMPLPTIIFSLVIRNFPPVDGVYD